jgi:two-component system sensor histidine kinase CreC
VFFLALFVRTELGEFKQRFRQATEEPLSDAVQVLAALLSEKGNDLSDIAKSTLEPALSIVRHSPLESRIYQLVKLGSDVRIYVVSERGRVLYDSRQPSEVGGDYSLWNDVIRALRGEYGARTTKESEYSTIYVTAPIRNNGIIIGALSVGKSVRGLDVFMESARNTTISFALVYGGVLVLTIFLMTAWITHPLAKLTGFAKAVAEGKKVQIPRVGGGELGAMAAAFEEMRVALEGKKYVERYLQTLSHEIKSPLSGIRGALEVLEDDDLPIDERHRFLGHIDHESMRLRDLNDKLVALSMLEAGSRAPDFSEENLSDLVVDVVTRFRVLAEQRNINIETFLDPSIQIDCDRNLLVEAFSNILHNSLSFSPINGMVRVELKRDNDDALFLCSDQGPGIPEWALNKVYEKFFSLPRPESTRKSTGLGLSLVNEIIQLHGGTLVVENRKDVGAVARIRLRCR